MNAYAFFELKLLKRACNLCFLPIILLIFFNKIAMQLAYKSIEIMLRPPILIRPFTFNAIFFIFLFRNPHYNRGSCYEPYTLPDSLLYITHPADCELHFPNVNNFLFLLEN